MFTTHHRAVSCIQVSTNGIVLQENEDTVPAVEDMEMAQLLSIPIPRVHKDTATKKAKKGPSSLRTKRGKV
jgi:hypothetical protein